MPNVPAEEKNCRSPPLTRCISTDGVHSLPISSDLTQASHCDRLGQNLMRSSSAASATISTAAASGDASRQARETFSVASGWAATCVEINQ